MPPQAEIVDKTKIMLSRSCKNIPATIAHHNGFTLYTSVVFDTAINFNEYI